VVAGLSVVVVGAAIALKNGGNVNAGLVGVALVGVVSLSGTVIVFATNWANFESDLTALTRVREFSLQTPTEQDDGDGTVENSWPEKGEVVFKKVTASWRMDLEPALRGINIEIKAGEKVGICGRTGSGKSSFVSTLFRLMDHVEGEISIDGVRIDSLKRQQLRSGLVSIPQDPFFILDDSVRDNLRCGDSQCTDQDLIDKLQRVKLWERLLHVAGEDSNPLDMKMSSYVDFFSEGEKQLFSLARALRTTGKVVVLDEVTSKYVYKDDLRFLLMVSRMDMESVKLMNRILLEAFTDRTVIAIVHQLSTIMDFDKVIVMDAGEIVEVGVPRLLMENELSLFGKLVEIGQS
jgi:ATP-binding cassette, subfamily C (CFTR/MRP), member 1